MNIYTLSDPDTLKVRYVGASINPQARYRQHTNKKRLDREKTYKANWIKGLLSQNKKPILDVIENCPDTWQEREKYWIAHYPDLTNHSIGGEGTNYSHSEETRRKLSVSSKGRKHTTDTKLRISASKKGTLFSEEHKKSLSDSAKARPRENYYGKNIKSHTFYKDGKVVTIDNLPQYCRDNDLNYESMRDLKRGKRRKYEGYTMV